MKKQNILFIFLLLFVSACSDGNESKELDDLTSFEDRQKQIQPRPVPNPDKNAYFGDLHVHTENSFDAYSFGTLSTPDDAYRYCLLYTSPSPRDGLLSRMPSSA